jgi:predicted outer membrane repeat protein
LLALLGLWVLALPAQGRVICVDASAAGDDNGSSWIHAYRYVQDALAAAESGDEIRIAEGTYTPDRGGGNTPGDREAMIQLEDGVSIYGGYPAGGGDPNTRDPNMYETIFSGDLNGNDEPNFVNNSENSYHVTCGAGCGPTAVLDGVTITGGNANGENTLENPKHVGGGMLNYSWKTLGNTENSPTLINCTFKENSARMGGGMLNFGDVAGGYGESSPTLMNCTFVNNRGIDDVDNPYGSSGGAICGFGDSPPTLTNCTFINNTATSITGDTGSGGAISGTGDITGCSFIGNTATGPQSSGGAIWAAALGYTIADSIFIGNSAGLRAGAISGGGTLDNCSFIGNI